MGKRVRKKSIIVQVRRSRTSKQKTVTIPKSARNIRGGDYVTIRRVR